MASIDFDNNEISHWVDEDGETYCHFAECILMQSTGLKDKNGVEIFEGDIVKNINTGSLGCIYWDVHNTGFFYKVKRQDQALFDGYTIFRANFNLEVIGNIYENPELLEKR